jgi:hypothetical protein
MACSNLLYSVCTFINSRTLILTTTTDLQQHQPPLYESLTKNLSPEEQSIIQGVINQADNITLQHQQQQDPAAQANGHNSPVVTQP